MKKRKIIIRYFVIMACIVFLSACSQKMNTTDNQNNSDELDLRIQNAYNRIMQGKNPELTQDFLLACLTLDKKFDRRFTNFSGDQPGRYLSAMSIKEIKNNPIDLHGFVEKVYLLQKQDGHFGTDTLSFTQSQITGEHMALLWGNGRLFAGLLDYYEKYKNEKALLSARKLGDFLVSVTQNCTTKENIEKLKKMGAMGFICFTQNIEGLVKLYRYTKDSKYIQLAETIYPLLPERGDQHSHGYLLTIRGVIMLYQETHKKEQLEYAITKYNDVINSPEFQITGGVPEFFGNYVPKEHFRNEGCSEADFVMLSLALWHATGNIEYLNKAEYCLMNELFYNQYQTGDFGSHQIDTTLGFRTYPEEDRAWWCCTYHGIMAMVDAQNNIVTLDKDARKLNLYFQNHYQDNEISFVVSKSKTIEKCFEIEIEKATDKEIEIEMRKPYWAKKVKIKINNKPIVPTEKNEYYSVRQKWNTQDKISIEFEFDLKIITKNGKTFTIETLPSQTIRGAITYGPWLLCIDDDFNWEFMSEPSSNNIIFIEQKNGQSLKNNVEIPKHSLLPEAYIPMLYKHDGFYGDNQVIMRPVSENTFQHPSNVQVWFNIQKR